jgi:flagellar biosynthetic protein FlhB
VRKRTNKQLRMTKDEVKRENKNTEGDPHLKGQIRSKQLAMARNRQMADVPTADVVLVNPTHVAVALRYDPEKGAPRVVAKGQGVIAAKIRELATENRIPMVQDVALARALEKGVEVGMEIPADFYGAVAKVLAFVMSLKVRGAAAGVHRNPNSTAAAAA